MILSLIESLDAETAVAHAGGDDTYSTYYQPGAVTHEIVAAAQVDRRGRVNTIALRKRDGGVIRLPGQGGMADVANMHRDYLLYITRHSVQSVVDEVEIASSARGLLTRGRTRTAWLPDRPGAGDHRPLRLRARPVHARTRRRRDHAWRHPRPDPRCHRLCREIRRRLPRNCPALRRDARHPARPDRSARLAPAGVRQRQGARSADRGNSCRRPCRGRTLYRRTGVVRVKANRIGR